MELKSRKNFIFTKDEKTKILFPFSWWDIFLSSVFTFLISYQKQPIYFQFILFLLKIHHFIFNYKIIKIIYQNHNKSLKTESRQKMRKNDNKIKSLMKNEWGKQNHTGVILKDIDLPMCCGLWAFTPCNSSLNDTDFSNDTDLSRNKFNSRISRENQSPISCLNVKLEMNNVKCSNSSTQKLSKTKKIRSNCFKAQIFWKNFMLERIIGVGGSHAHQKKSFSHVVLIGRLLQWSTRRK